MILKFHRHLLEGKSGWIILSDVRDIEYHTISDSIRKKAKFAVDYYIEHADPSSRRNAGDYLPIVVYRRDSTVTTICAGVPTYLLNDSGKILEKLK